MSFPSTPSLPKSSKALIVTSTSPGPLTLTTFSTPTPAPGSVVIKVLTSLIQSHHLHLYTGGGAAHFFPFPLPFVPGCQAIGRVAAVGEDGSRTGLKEGTLVLLDPYIRARDDNDVQIIQGLFHLPSPPSERIMKDVWRDGYWSEYVRIPLENAHPLDEQLLTSPKSKRGELGGTTGMGYGYTLPQLLQMGRHLVAYGGLRDIDLKAGETVLISPASGGYSGAAVEVASAMGARVLAVSRNSGVLKDLASRIPRVTPLVLTGDAAHDAAVLAPYIGQVDAYLDLTPQTLPSPPFFDTLLPTLRNGARISLMGACGELKLPYAQMMLKNITVKGKFMYERRDVQGVIRMVQSGVLSLGSVRVEGVFGMENWKEGLDKASGCGEAGKVVAFVFE